MEKIVEEELIEENVPVAMGTEPIPGKNGGIEYKVSLSKDLTPSVKDDGSVDFREVKSITQLSRGDIIAEQIPPTEGTPGKAVTGEEIPPTPGKPYVLNPSENISVSKDGTQLIAEKNGVLSKDKDLLVLKDYLEIPGDVDFEVGNISFPGRIIINGSVRPGFTVEGGDDVLIHGDVEAATIKSKEGSVQIEQGIIGKDTAYIYSPKRVNVNFAQNCTLETEGLINVENSLLHCSCYCKNFQAETNAKVIGGMVEAEQSIEIGHSGNKDNTKTELIVDDKQRRELQNKRQQLTEALSLLEKQQMPLMRDIKNKKKLISKVGSDALSPKVKQQVVNEANQLKSIEKKLNLIRKNLLLIEEELEKDFDQSGYVTIAGTIHSGTMVRLYREVHKVKSEATGKIFRIVRGEMKVSNK
ncbi:DUF342 domain-containing protein [Chitinivibrio alkaliphilus]|uniref:DUF342 domain-containing protein n=1 Tax=Chitinivibrio alkaliphilus TaxID=1505232 RepID=UPI0004002C00|nr:FapA family protein [Chitinivibrio alkaliphilus]